MTEHPIALHATADRPKSLLQHAGASATPASLEDAVLVLIDYQEEYRTGSLPLTGVGPALATARALLEVARTAGAPVIHVVHHGRAGGALFDPEGAKADILEELAPKEGEIVLAKKLPNAFAGTDLLAHVQGTGRTELVIAGFMTHLCVSATVRAALDHGFRSTVVARACATRDLPDPAGGIVAAADVHRATLAALGDRFAIVVENETALAA